MKILFSAVVFLFFFASVSYAQTPTQEAARLQAPPVSEELLKAILSEIKQLRSTLTKTSVNQMRFQTTFEQYKSQQSRIDFMNRELDSIKSQLAATNPFRATSEDLIKQTEERLAQATDPRIRENFERQLQSVKRNIEAQDTRDKRSKERQSALEFQIPVEQGKLDQLNAELERIKLDINSLLNQ